ncbi:MAG: citrate synthase [Duganella sp.]
MVWMTAAQALDVLSVRPQTLYANVSRGKVRAKPDETDPRRSLYHRDDILRMARRANGRRKVDAVSAQAMQYGDPVLPTALSTALGGRLLYRGHDAAGLAHTASLEDIAALLWQCDPAVIAARLAAAPTVPVIPARRPPPTGSALAAGLLALAASSATAPPSLGRPRADLHADAAAVLATVATALIGQPASAQAPGSIAARLAVAWQCVEHEDLLRRALVLMADHELNASTFATRVAISTGASLAAGVLAGFTTLTGPLHGGAAARLAQLLVLAGDVGAHEAVRRWRRGGQPLPGFGHPLYPEGDPRASALLPLLPRLPLYAALADAAYEQAGELPSTDFALALLASACPLPPDAPFMLFALGRCVGWLAHALEQVQANQLIRPRARYVGPPGPG